MPSHHTVASLLRRQGKNHILSRTSGRNGVVCRRARLEHSVAANGHSDIFTIADLIYGGNALLWSGKIIFPKNLTVVLIIGTKFAIGRAARKNQTARSDDNTSTRRDAADVFAGIAEGRHAAVRHLP